MAKKQPNTRQHLPWATTTTPSPTPMASPRSSSFSSSCTFSSPVGPFAATSNSFSLPARSLRYRPVLAGIESVRLGRHWNWTLPRPECGRCWMVGNRNHNNVCSLPTGLQGNIPDGLVYSRRWCQVTAYYNQELDQVRACPTQTPFVQLMDIL